MHTHNGERERTEAGHPDGRRNFERCTVQDARGMELPAAIDPVDGSVCMNATLNGAGGVKGR